MSPEDIGMWIGLAIAVATLCGILYAAWIKARKAWQRGRQETVAVRDAILGRDAVVDTITRREVVPALPGIGVRMANQEEQMAQLTATVQLLADQKVAHDALERQVKDIDGRVTKLEQGTVERIVGKTESTMALRVIEQALLAEPHLDVDADEDDDVVDVDPEDS